MDSHTISSSNIRYKLVMKDIVKFQNGSCRFCKNKFTEEDIIISRKGRPRKYYHNHCARLLHIV
jgi:hypothetical protein